VFSSCDDFSSALDGSLSSHDRGIDIYVFFPGDGDRSEREKCFSKDMVRKFKFLRA